MAVVCTEQGFETSDQINKLYNSKRNPNPHGLVDGMERELIVSLGSGRETIRPSYRGRWEKVGYDPFPTPPDLRP